MPGRRPPHGSVPPARRARCGWSDSTWRPRRRCTRWRSGSRDPSTVSSITHHNGDGAVLEGNPAQGYTPNVTYGRTKLANLLFALELQRRATASGSRLTSTAAHPGISGTNLIASRDGMGAIPVIGAMAQWSVRLIFPNPDQGAEAILYAATDAAPGSYSGPTGFRETRGPVGEAKQSALARDETLAALLWERSVELTGVAVTP